MKKIGVIADIHADIEALKIALDRLYNYHRVNLIMCAGDLTGYGKEPNAVIELIRSQRIITVRGNHDAPSADISPENADYLRALPFHWGGEVEGVRLFMCHGRPNITFMGFHPDYVTDDELNDLLTSLEADVVIAGHTHIPMVKKVEKGYVINPGAVYARSLEGSSHSYGVLHLPAVEFKLYDLKQPPGTEIKLDTK